MASGDKTIDKITRALRKTYKQAEQEAQQRLNDYMTRFKDEYKRRQALLSAGGITQAEFNQWYAGKIAQGKHWDALIQIIARDYTKANENAMKMVNGELPNIFGYHANEAAEEIIGQLPGTAVDIKGTWELYDRDTIQRLATEDRQLLPTRSVDIPKDMRWNQRHIQSALTTGLLQGDSIERLADRLQGVTDMNRNAAIRNARTMVTGAENAGRQTSYDRMTKRGVKMKKVWMSTPDARTRDAHIVMDGQEVEEDEFFTDGEGNKLMYPGDPNGDPASVYNCRCTMHAKVEGFDFGKAQEAEKEEPKPTAPQEEAQEELKTTDKTTRSDRYTITEQFQKIESEDDRIKWFSDHITHKEGWDQSDIEGKYFNLQAYLGDFYSFFHNNEPRWEKAIAMLDETLNDPKMPVFNGTIYRGMQIPIAKNSDGIGGVDAIEAILKSGQWTEPGISSFSSDKEWALRFSGINQPFEDRDSENQVHVLLRVNGNTRGVAVDNISTHPESEVLMPSDQAIKGWRITGVERKTNGKNEPFYIIDLEE